MNKRDRNKLKDGNLVVVWWQDITEHINDEFKDVHLAECRSVGWVLGVKEKEKIEYVQIASSEYTDGDHRGNGTSSTIPLGCIFKVERINDGKQKA